MSVTVLIPIHRDGNKDWLQECIDSFPYGTRYLVCENDGELADAMNEGLAMVETEWVLPFGSDDVAQPDMVKNLMDRAEDADVVYPAMIFTTPELEPTGRFEADLFCANRLQIWNYVPGGFLARTSKVREAGGWRDLDALEDWDLHVRLLRVGARFKPCPEAEFLYRQTPGSRNKVDHGFGSFQEFKEHYQREIVGTAPDVKATFYYQATPATAYWRCLLPARYLPGVATTELSLMKRGDRVELGDHKGAGVFQFPASQDRGMALAAMKAAGVPYLVEIDDNYLDESDPRVRRRAGWDLQFEDGPHSVQVHRWITQNADGVIASTRTLGEIYGDVNENVHVCPNQIDPTDWPELEKPDDGVFRIGWFLSPSHDRDGVLVRRALSWASRQPGVSVVTIGHDPGWQDFTRVHVPWTDDFTGYRKTLQLLDVGVAPILRTGWSICRSDLKVLEYAMAGAMTIASREPPYEDWFDDRLALTASTAKDFEQQVKWCVKNKDEARRMARGVREHVLRERTVAANIGKWEVAVAAR